MWISERKAMSFVESLDMNTLRSFAQHLEPWVIFYTAIVATTALLVRLATIQYAFHRRIVQQFFGGKRVQILIPSFSGELHSTNEITLDANRNSRRSRRISKPKTKRTVQRYPVVGVTEVDFYAVHQLSNFLSFYGIESSYALVLSGRSMHSTTVPTIWLSGPKNSDLVRSALMPKGASDLSFAPCLLPEETGQEVSWVITWLGRTWRSERTNDGRHPRCTGVVHQFFDCGQNHQKVTLITGIHGAGMAGAVHYLTQVQNLWKFGISRQKAATIVVRSRLAWNPFTVLDALAEAQSQTPRIWFPMTRIRIPRRKQPSELSAQEQRTSEL